MTLLAADDVGELLQSPDWMEQALQPGPRRSISDVDAAPLVLNPAKVLCVGLNYSKHIIEMGRDLPVSPTLFTKFASSLCGARDPIPLPPESTQVDWEAELAVVIGRPGRRIPQEQALGHVAGYTVLNDVSMRDWQNRTTQFLAGKAWERSSPLGPFLVTPDELPRGAEGLRITCSVNDEIVQDDSTGDLLFGVAALIAYISTFTSLTPGDIIATGTPGGVGAGRTPPRFLSPGDRLRTSIEGIGELDNLITSG
ncbi:MAG: fumarylacetoacetate hydrolase family protein [Actinomycetota bacterium]